MCPDKEAGEAVMGEPGAASGAGGQRVSEGKCVSPGATSQTCQALGQTLAFLGVTWEQLQALSEA